jgi:hypothetical protein
MTKRSRTRVRPSASTVTANGPGSTVIKSTRLGPGRKAHTAKPTTPRPTAQ